MGLNPFFEEKPASRVILDARVSPEYSKVGEVTRDLVTHLSRAHSTARSISRAFEDTAEAADDYVSSLGRSAAFSSRIAASLRDASGKGLLSGTAAAKQYESALESLVEGHDKVYNIQVRLRTELEAVGGDVEALRQKWRQGLGQEVQRDLKEATEQIKEAEQAMKSVDTKGFWQRMFSLPGSGPVPIQWDGNKIADNLRNLSNESLSRGGLFGRIRGGSSRLASMFFSGLEKVTTPGGLPIPTSIEGILGSLKRVNPLWGTLIGGIAVAGREAAKLKSNVERLSSLFSVMTLPSEEISNTMHDLNVTFRMSGSEAANLVEQLRQGGLKADELQRTAIAMHSNQVALGISLESQLRLYNLITREAGNFGRDLERGSLLVNQMVRQAAVFGQEMRNMTVDKAMEGVEAITRQVSGLDVTAENIPKQFFLLYSAAGLAALGIGKAGRMTQDMVKTIGDAVLGLQEADLATQLLGAAMALPGRSLKEWLTALDAMRSGRDLARDEIPGMGRGATGLELRTRFLFAPLYTFLEQFDRSGYGPEGTRVLTAEALKQAGSPLAGAPAQVLSRIIEAAQATMGGKSVKELMDDMENGGQYFQGVINKAADAAYENGEITRDMRDELRSGKFVGINERIEDQARKIENWTRRSAGLLNLLVMGAAFPGRNVVGKLFSSVYGSEGAALEAFTSGQTISDIDSIPEYQKAIYSRAEQIWEDAKKELEQTAGSALRSRRKAGIETIMNREQAYQKAAEEYRKARENPGGAESKMFDEMRRKVEMESKQRQKAASDQLNADILGIVAETDPAKRAAQFRAAFKVNKKLDGNEDPFRLRNASLILQAQEMMKRQGFGTTYFNSGYRTDAENRAAGGDANSKHRGIHGDEIGDAVDLTFTGGKRAAYAMHDYAEELARQQGKLVNVIVERTGSNPNSFHLSVIEFAKERRDQYEASLRHEAEKMKELKETIGSIRGGSPARGSLRGGSFRGSTERNEFVLRVTAESYANETQSNPE